MPTTPSRTPRPSGATIARGVAGGDGGAVVLFGVKPTSPATGYGYIEPGEPLADGVRRVARFVEKPPRPDAERLCAAGASGTAASS